MNDEPPRGSYFTILVMAGLVGYGFHALGGWADGGQYKVYNILSGGQPEFTFKSVVAILAYGVAISCLGIMLGCIGMLIRSAMPGKRVGTRDILFAGRAPSEAAGQFKAYGCLLMVAILLVIFGIGGAVVLCIWQGIASSK